MGGPWTWQTLPPLIFNSGNELRLEWKAGFDKHQLLDLDRGYRVAGSRYDTWQCGVYDPDAYIARPFWHQDHATQPVSLNDLLQLPFTPGYHISPWLRPKMVQDIGPCQRTPPPDQQDFDAEFYSAWEQRREETQQRDRLRIKREVEELRRQEIAHLHEQVRQAESGDHANTNHARYPSPFSPQATTDHRQGEGKGYWQGKTTQRQTVLHEM